MKIKYLLMCFLIYITTLNAQQLIIHNSMSFNMSLQDYYNPFSTTDSIYSLNLLVDNLNPDKSYFISIENNKSNQNFIPQIDSYFQLNTYYYATYKEHSLNYQLFNQAHKFTPISDRIDLTEFNSSMNPQSKHYEIQLIVEQGQVIPPGNYKSLLSFNLYEGDSETPFDSLFINTIEIDMSFTVNPHLHFNLQNNLLPLEMSFENISTQNNIHLEFSVKSNTTYDIYKTNGVSSNYTETIIFSSNQPTPFTGQIIEIPVTLNKNQDWDQQFNLKIRPNKDPNGKL